LLPIWAEHGPHDHPLSWIRYSGWSRGLLTTVPGAASLD
jgi:hypothetical protein